MKKSVTGMIISALFFFILIACSNGKAPEKPIGLGYHSMAYDSESEVTVLFGGQPRDYEMIAVNPTWVYHGKTSSWEKMNPAPSPPKSAGNSMAYDSESDRVILFSRQETWTYDYNTNSWEKRTPEKTPVASFGASIAYDAESDRMILFGLPSNQTWAYDYNKDSWELMSPVISPPKRQYAAMAYDPESDRTILFGGGDGKLPPNYNLIYNDTWAYDYNSDRWTELQTVNKPVQRAYHTMTWVPSIKKIIAYGGWSYDDKNTIDTNIWQLDFNLNEWSILPEEQPELPLRKHAMVFDSSISSIFIYGGIAGPLQLNGSPQFSSESYIIELK